MLTLLSHSCQCWWGLRSLCIECAHCQEMNVIVPAAHVYVSLLGLLSMSVPIASVDVGLLSISVPVASVTNNLCGD